MATLKDAVVFKYEQSDIDEFERFAAYSLSNCKCD